MSARQDTREEVAFTANLQSLVATYEEIAVMRIEQVRKVVLAARLFRENLTEVFDAVRASHQNQIAIALTRKKTAIKYRDKEAWLLFSTNSRLAGPVTSEVTRAFVKDLKETNSQPQVVVVGEVGKERFASLMPDLSYKYFYLPDTDVDYEALHTLISYLLQYEVVTIFFARFHNLIEQKPTRIDIGEKELLAHTPQTSRALWFQVPKSLYLFEPSLEDVVEFFSKEVFAVLMQQTRQEAWLSLLGSRITAMEQASFSIAGRLKSLLWQERREDRRLRNRKQRDQLTGMTLWHNK